MNKKRFILLTALAGLALIFALGRNTKLPDEWQYKIVSRKHGLASWYMPTRPGTEWQCASWDYPIGSFVKITNAANGKSVICEVGDRGPAKNLNRIIDLSKTAFAQISDKKEGVIEVTVGPV